MLTAGVFFVESFNTKHFSALLQATAATNFLLYNFCPTALHTWFKIHYNNIMTPADFS